MKKYLQLSLFIILTIVITPFQSVAQFAPIGSKWTFENSRWGHKGVFISSVERDTLILGKKCQILEQKDMYQGSHDIQGNFITRIDIWNTHLLYSTADTVFEFIPNKNKFLPTYIFNVHKGDTVSFYTIPFENLSLKGGGGKDSIFQFIVDSTNYVLYDNQSLKTIYAHDAFVDKMAAWYFGKPQFIYAEKIGNIRGGLFPDYMSCQMIWCGSPDSLRCYSDNQSSIKLVKDDCDYKISPIKNNGHLLVFPNPGSEGLYIVYSGNSSTTATIQVVDVLGKKLMQINNQVLNYDPFKIEINTWAAGIYFVAITPENGHKEWYKFVKE